MYCVYCGSKLKANAVFCGKCGMRVTEKSNIPSTTEEIVYAEEKPMKQLADTKIIISLVFAIVAIAILSIISISLITSNTHGSLMYNCNYTVNV